MKLTVCVTAMLALACAAAFAAGAPWYKWISQESGAIVCTQSPPGEGWVVFQGPFSESRCRQLGNPK